MREVWTLPRVPFKSANSSVTCKFFVVLKRMKIPLFCADDGDDAFKKIQISLFCANDRGDASSPKKSQNSYKKGSTFFSFLPMTGMMLFLMIKISVFCADDELMTFLRQWRGWCLFPNQRPSILRTCDPRQNCERISQVLPDAHLHSQSSHCKVCYCSVHIVAWCKSVQSAHCGTYTMQWYK